MNEGWCLSKIFGAFFVLFTVNWVLPELISNYCRMKWQLCNRCQIRNSKSDLSMHNTIGYRSYIDSTQHLMKHYKSTKWIISFMRSRRKSFHCQTIKTLQSRRISRKMNDGWRLCNIFWGLGAFGVYLYFFKVIWVW